MKLSRGLLALTAALVILPAGWTFFARPSRGSRRPEPGPQEKAAADGPRVIQGKTIDEWLTALKDRDPAVRKRAVEVLGARALDPDGDPDEKARLQSAVGSLLFSDTDAEVRRAVASFADRARASRSPGGERPVFENDRAARRDQLLEDQRTSIWSCSRAQARDPGGRLTEAVPASTTARRWPCGNNTRWNTCSLSRRNSAPSGRRSGNWRPGSAVIGPDSGGQRGTAAAHLRPGRSDRLVERHPDVAELAAELAEREKRREAVKDTQKRLDTHAQEVRPEAEIGKRVETGRRRAARRVRTSAARLAVLFELERRLEEEIKTTSATNTAPRTVNALDLQSFPGKTSPRCRRLWTGSTRNWRRSTPLPAAAMMMTRAESKKGDHNRSPSRSLPHRSWARRSTNGRPR